MNEELVKAIDRVCYRNYGYDILTMREMIKNYCKARHIRLDSSGWIYLIDEMWCDLRHIRAEFDDIESFEFSIKDNLF